MFLFMAFDLYVVKVIGGYPKDKHRQLKIILYSALNNKLRATHATSMFA
jgi:hypothetical protein